LAQLKPIEVRIGEAPATFSVFAVFRSDVVVS